MGSRALGQFLDDFLGGLFGADEKNASPLRDRIAEELRGLADLLRGFGEIDDVDPVPRGKNKFLHLGVPPVGPVSEMDAGLE
ncbi:MAG: hypothetical protein EBT36_12630 [Betaproteobacteria bacterium]|nr:hypothetical protein [Betaproteobacteria bacterium]